MVEQTSERLLSRRRALRPRSKTVADADGWGLTIPRSVSWGSMAVWGGVVRGCRVCGEAWIHTALGGLVRRPGCHGCLLWNGTAPRTHMMGLGHGLMNYTCTRNAFRTVPRT